MAIPITFIVTSGDSGGDNSEKSKGEQNATILVRGVFLNKPMTIGTLNLGEVRLMLGGESSTYTTIAGWCNRPSGDMSITKSFADADLINWIKTYPNTPLRLLFPS